MSRRWIKVYGPSVTQQHAAALQKLRDPPSCWEAYLHICKENTRATAETRRRWKRLTQDRIDELARGALLKL